MFKYIIVPLVVSASPSEFGWLRATALDRSSRVDALLTDVSSRIESQISKLKIKQSLSERFDCGRFPPIRAADDAD